MTRQWLRAAAVLSLAFLVGAAPAAAAPGDFIGMIGDGIDQPLEYPHMNVGLAADGRIFVNDYGNGDLKVFNPDFTLRESWNETHPDREYPQYPIFLNAHSIALHGDRVYVVVGIFDEVQVYTLAGEHLFDIRHPLELPCAWYPSGIATDAAGNVYVGDNATDFFWRADPETGVVHKEWCGRKVLKFDADGRYLTFFGTVPTDPDRTPGSYDGTLGYPEGVFVDREGRVYVTDSDRVVIYAPDGTWLRSFGTSGSAAGQFNLPMGLSVDRNGRIYVSDAFNNRVQVFENDGTPVASWGFAPEGSPWYVPTGVTLDPASNRLFVTDMWNHRIVALEAFPVSACGYTWQGFLPPVSLGKAFQAGSTIPVKFELKDCDGKPADGVKATLSLRQGGTEVAAKVAKAKKKGKRLAAGDNSFKSLGDGLYRFNLSTKNLAAGTWTLVVTLDDGTEKTRVVRIK